MNCEHAQREWLLAQSGELPAGRRARLEAHLSACKACRSRCEERLGLMAMVRSNPPARHASDAVVRRILVQAANEPARRPPEMARWLPPLAAAAGFLLLVGILAVVAPRHQRAPGVASNASPGETSSSDVSSLLAMLMEHDGSSLASSEDTDRDGALGFARQLLMLEGLDVEVSEEPAAELNRLEELQPTTLLWRSRLESPAGRCG